MSRACAEQMEEILAHFQELATELGAERGEDEAAFPLLGARLRRRVSGGSRLVVGAGSRSEQPVKPSTSLEGV